MIASAKFKNASMTSSLRVDLQRALGAEVPYGLQAH
jgi:hypothetical protein